MVLDGRGPAAGSRRGRRLTRHPGAGLLFAAALIAVVAAAAACSGSGGSSKSAADILGHTPAGVAKTVIDQNTISVATDINFPPGSHLDPTTNQPVGFDVDIATRIAAALGVKPEIVNPNWDLVAAGLEAGRYDAAAGFLVVATGGQQTVQLTKPYYYTSAQLVVGDKAEKVTLDALAGKRVGVAVQSTYQAYLQRLGGVVVVPFTDDAEALAGLAGGEVAAVLTDDLTAHDAVAAGQPVQVAGKALFYQPVAFAVKKGEGDLAALLDHAIDTLRADGTLATIARQWFQRDVAAPPAGVPSYAEAMATAK